MIVVVVVIGPTTNLDLVTWGRKAFLKKLCKEINKKSGPGHLGPESGPFLIKYHQEINRKSGSGHLKPENGPFLVKLY